jgi:hypothetical protein
VCVRAPMASSAVSLDVRRVKLASRPHIRHTAESFVIDSALGASSSTAPKGFRWKSPGGGPEVWSRGAVREGLARR